VVTSTHVFGTGGRVFFWGCALGDVRQGYAVPWPKWHAGDPYVPEPTYAATNSKVFQPFWTWQFLLGFAGGIGGHEPGVAS
jgi:hypothetical protein